MANLFKELGHKLVDNGFNILPIVRHDAKDHSHPGKAPALKGWRTHVASHDSVTLWADTRAKCGIGINTRTNPAVDLDILDADMCRRMMNYVELATGETAVRIGRAPKALMLFHTKVPFTKVKSHTWICPNGDKHAVEVLGDGQQFVAYGVHPGTGKPFQWLNDFRPDNSIADFDLPEITLLDARAICDEFDRAAADAGWTIDEETKSRTRGAVAAEDNHWDEDDADIDPDTAEVAEDLRDTWDGTVEELAELMAQLPPENDYGRWFAILAALKDGEREPDEFKEIAREWSSKADNFDDDAFEDKWENGGFGRLALTRDTPVAKINDLKKWVKAAHDDKKVLEKVIPGIDRSNTRDSIQVWDKRLRKLNPSFSVREKAIQAIVKAYERVDANRELVPLDEPINPYSFPHLSDNKNPKPLTTIENMEHMLKEYGLTVGFNVISKTKEIFGWPAGHETGSASVEDRSNAELATIESLCNMNRMPSGAYARFYSNIAARHPHNPVEEWVTSKPWDGESRLQALYDTVKSPMTPSLKHTLIRRWLISAVAMGIDGGSSRRQARGVLVFTGLQYIGKTRWVLSLTPPGSNLVLEGVRVDPDSKDSVLKAVSHWICELGELDATFRKADIAALKAFVSQGTDVIRKPYAPDSSTFARRTVFFGSVNDTQYLVDDTGNTRWWTIPVTALNHNHDIDMQQLWAEVYELYRDGEQHWLTPDENDQLAKHNQRHENTDPYEEHLLMAFDWDAPRSTWTTRMCATEVLRTVLGTRDPGLRECRRVGAALRRLTGVEPTITGKARLATHLLPPKLEKNGFDDFDDDEL